MNIEKLKIGVPLYLMMGPYNCDGCNAEIEVVALLAPNVLNFQDYVEGRVAIISDIVEIPPNILAEISSHNSYFRLRDARYSDSMVFANSCPHCDEMVDDFYIICEPDGPFMPMNKREARKLKLVELPIKEPFEIGAGLGRGSGEVILRFARRLEPVSP